ncbi:MAG: hypothetical protein F6J93_38135 [Oscillatoria sp. SIO1A7]|nr:hypothetical protein [Oscillatoria sp. SIO1A7]
MQAVEVAIAGNSAETTFSAEELTPHKPPREKVSMSVIEGSLAKLQRGIRLAIAGAADKVRELSAQNEVLQEEVRTKSERIGDLKKEVPSAQALQLANQKLSTDLEEARTKLAEAEVAQKEQELALELLEQQKEKELRIARTNALVSDDASGKIQALKDQWAEDRQIVMDRLRDANSQVDEMEAERAQLQEQLNDNAIASIVKACEKLGITAPITSPMPIEQSLFATARAIGECSQSIVDWVNSQEGDWLAA